MKTTINVSVFVMMCLVSVFIGNAQDAIITADYSKPQTSYYRPGVDHNIVHGVVTEYQKSIYRQNSPRIFRNFLTMKSFYADETKNVMKSKAELDQLFQSDNYNYKRINDIAQSLLFTMKVTPKWMGQDATFSYSGLESAMKSILTYLKQTFSKFEYLECWNEPDLFIDTEPGLPNGAETPANYTLIYECYEKAVKYVNATVNNGPKLKIGGPVTSSYKTEWVNTLLKFVKDKNLQLDFIAWHSYQNFGGNPGKEVGYCKTSLNSFGMKAQTLVSEFGNFAGGHQAEGSAADRAKQAATVMDQSYGFSMAGGDVLMTWVAEHVANELKSIFPYDACTSNQQAAWQTYDFSNVSAKYFFLQFHTTAALVNTVVKEIQVLDENDKPVVLSKVRGSSYLTDNNESTVWTSTSDGNYTGTGEHMYSVATAVKVSKIKILWGGTGKYRFDLYHSSNATQWYKTTGIDCVNPVGHLIFMESKLGSQKIASTSTNVAVNALTTISDTSLSMIVYSRSDASSFNTSVRISNIPSAFLNKKLVVRRYLTDETHSNYAFNKSKSGLEKVCDSIVTTTGSINLNFTLVKNAVTLIEIVQWADPGTLKKLTVTSGSGSGYYTPGKVITLIATPAVLGKVFDKWTGSVSGVAAVGSASTTYTMPNADASITATYKDAQKYTLTVNSGTGSGSYFEGETISISANTPAIGKVFNAWTGTTNTIGSVSSATTTIIMPGANTAITASYSDIIYKSYTLTVTNGTGSGSYTTGSKVSISAAVTTGKAFDKWVGAVSGIEDIMDPTTTFIIGANNAAITATYKSLTDIEESAEPSLSVYPNPAAAYIAISNCSAFCSIRIVSVTGVMIADLLVCDREQVTLSLENATEGAYIIVLTDEKGKIRSLNFIKQ